MSSTYWWTGGKVSKFRKAEDLIDIRFLTYNGRNDMYLTCGLCRCGKLSLTSSNGSYTVLLGNCCSPHYRVFSSIHAWSIGNICTSSSKVDPMSSQEHVDRTNYNCLSVSKCSAWHTHGDTIYGVGASSTATHAPK